MKVLSIFTDDPLYDEDILLRSIWPSDKRPYFWNGKRLASSAFKDPKGLSVSRVYNRTMDEAVGWMKSYFQGPVYSVTYSTCVKIQTVVKSIPSPTVPYHYEIHGGPNHVLLSDIQALLLSREAEKVAD